MENQKRMFPETELNNAYNRYQDQAATDGKRAVERLATEVASLLSWNPNEGGSVRTNEMLWEIGVLLEKGKSLTRTIFFHYAYTTNEFGCVPNNFRIA
jgi:hypothetical protein